MVERVQYLFATGPRAAIGTPLGIGRTSPLVSGTARASEGGESARPATESAGPGGQSARSRSRIGRRS